jgi:3-hydroxypropanoate dehydrogenase
MSAVLDDKALDLIFREARTRNGWADTPVSDDEIKAVYDLFKWGPTAVNSTPARIVWIKSEEAKQRLAPHLSAGNRAKSMKAPVIAIIGYDLDFAQTMPKLFPHAPSAKDWFPPGPATEAGAFRNGTLQGAYLIIAARALGLDAGPMSGFDNAGVDAEFFAGTAIKSNFIVALGHGTDENLHPRNPRLGFGEANTIL